ncbi:hypothetical protein, partial [Nocardioides massiliensis]
MDTLSEYIWLILVLGVLAVVLLAALVVPRLRRRARPLPPDRSSSDDLLPPPPEADGRTTDAGTAVLDEPPAG